MSMGDAPEKDKQNHIGHHPTHGRASASAPSAMHMQRVPINVNRESGEAINAERAPNAVSGKGQAIPGSFRTGTCTHDKELHRHLRRMAHTSS